ncbi:hypothetical protein [Pelagicoccus sp. SDUM812005]|uniref:hypothetical protein n=1 Tax=Pelagicoccus sp. SDUM812005 TaxID=3041257 RepID=UPI00280FE158|nr:hypothetical protein [Pelagicoccus sp. SDUM812005]MDQ8179203.1 hypothetical protein [Pelagicoccus sp. SDUM812005]
MKNLKSTLTVHTAIASAATVCSIAFMALPSLAAFRESLSAQLGLAGQLGLWLPVAATAAAAHGLAYVLSVRKIAAPFQKLATNASHCEQGFAFKTKSNTKEEDVIKHAIETNNLKTKEAQQVAEELEADLEQLKSKLEAAEAKIESLGSAKASAEKAASELRLRCETLNASKVALELTLENERKSKIGAEVEKRAEEIYSQMQKAVSAASLKSIWLPSFVHQLKGPASVINEISAGLRNNCSETPLTQIAAQIEQIHLQTEKQLATLQGILDTQVLELASDPLPPQSKQARSNEAINAIASEGQTPCDEDELDSEFDASPRQIGLAMPEPVRSPARLESAEQPESPHSIENVLGSIIDHFSPLAPDAHLSYTVDTELGIEIEDDTLLALMRALTQAAVNSVDEGEITLGVELTTEHLVFDIACEGDIVFSDPACIDKAGVHARKLGGHIDIDRPGENELHFSFSYPLEAPAPAEEDVIEIQSQRIGSEPLS